MVRFEEIHEYPNPDVRKLAKAVADELRNQGALVDLREAQHVLAAESEVPYQYYDEAGHEVDPSSPQCEKSGSRKASLDPRFVCASCGKGLDPREPQCSSCGGRLAIPTELLNARFECERCGLPILDPSSQSTCANCGHAKAIFRESVK